MFVEAFLGAIEQFGFRGATASMNMYIASKASNARTEEDVENNLHWKTSVTRPKSNWMPNLENFKGHFIMWTDLQDLDMELRAFLVQE